MTTSSTDLGQSLAVVLDTARPKLLHCLFGNKGNTCCFHDWSQIAKACSWSNVGSSFVQNVLLHLGICWVGLQDFVAHINSVHKAAGLQIIECKLVANGR